MQVPFATKFGESLAIVSSPDWENPTRLQWTDGDVWTGEVEAKQGKFEYKYVILRAGGIGEWQPGANMMIDVPSKAAIVHVDDRWLAEDRIVWVECPASKPASVQAKHTIPNVTAVANGPLQETSALHASTSTADSTPDAAHSSTAQVDSSTAPGGGLHKMTVVRLRQILKSYKLKSTGKKAELITRLQQHLSAQQ